MIALVTLTSEKPIHQEFPGDYANLARCIKDYSTANSDEVSVERLLSFAGITTMPPGTLPGFGDLPGPQKDDILSKCNSDACRSAKTRVEDLRSAIALACNKAADAEKNRNTFSLAAAALIPFILGLLAAAATATASVAGIPVAAILLAVALLFLIAFGILSAITLNWQTKVEAAQQEAQSLRTQFVEAASEMRKACSEYCLVDSTVPTCGTAS